ncbi:uncharacterized protein LOC128471516 [Spea bombifrons]|uniref:uncharacterized protein LOC128471516 n=1 Tax=Spea bombifrons TaxID=233779 RepID=UPI00234AB0B4|nr:uncharacterized protein LOC128471516 [Spea bombifrons]
MSALFQCCCAEPPEEEESKPFAHTARNPKQVKVLKKGDKLVLKHVNVPDFDERFSEIADLYNEQMENNEIMSDCALRLKEKGASTSLAGCVQNLREKNSNCDIGVQMEGYNFSLVATSEEELPETLKEAQELMKKLSRSTKFVIGNQTKLGELVFSLLQRKTQISDEIRQANSAYLDQVRLEDNLKENVHNIEQAKLLSNQYAEDANVILREIAAIAGIDNI